MAFWYDLVRTSSFLICRIASINASIQSGSVGAFAYQHFLMYALNVRREPSVHALQA